MTVAELVAQLQALPQDLSVMVYCEVSEDADEAHMAYVVKAGERRPYTKMGWPDITLRGVGQKDVVIVG